MSLRRTPSLIAPALSYPDHSNDKTMFQHSRWASLRRIAIVFVAVGTAVWLLLHYITIGTHPDLADLKDGALRALVQLNTVPPAGDVDKAFVMAKTRGESVAWAHDLRPEWTPYIYTDSEPPESGYALRPPSHRGREAMTYLTFIIDNYHALPKYTAFIHAGAQQWHNEDIGPYTSNILMNLRLDTVDRRGYINLRCKLDPGCPVSIEPKHPSVIDVANRDIRAYLADVWMELFDVPASHVPDAVGSACCAQFAVSRKRILERPLADYVRMRKWAIETKITDSFGVGWTFEKIWHIIFGMEAVDCPDPAICRCDLFGWCGPPASETCAKQQVFPEPGYAPRRDDYARKEWNKG